MKYALLNYSGNVGKTTLARDMLHMNLPDSELISVESVNADGEESILIRGDDGDKLLEEILLNDDLIIDIGSSNLEQFFRNSSREKELIESIDFFIIPTTSERKQQFDTIKTIRDLIEANIKEENILVIFNQIPDNNEMVEEIFSDFLSLARKIGISTDLSFIIYKHDLYTKGDKLKDLLVDTDFKQLMEEAKQSGNKEKAREYANLYVKQKKARSLQSCYQQIFTKIQERLGK